MSLAVTAKLSLGISAYLSNPQNLTSGTKKVSDNVVIPFDNGNSSGQIQAEWDDERTISASGEDVLDLSGSLKDVFGNTILFAQIKVVIIVADEDNTNNVLVGGTDSPDAAFTFMSDPSDIIPVKPGGMLVWVAPGTGATVSGGTGDKFKIANSGGTTSVTYKIYLMGTAALTPA